MGLVRATRDGLECRADAQKCCRSGLSGAGGHLFGYSQWSRLLSRHSANVVAPYSLLVPFFGVLSASLFLGETLDGLQVLGGVLLVAGLATGSPVIRRLFWRGQKA